MTGRVIIIGSGHGGIQAADSLRVEGFEGTILLFSNESDLPYQKPPLSKGYLQGKQSEVAIRFRSDSYYENNDIELHLGVRIMGISTEEKYIETETGIRYGYTHLIIATGARNRKLHFEGKLTENVHYLRNLSDAKIIEQKLETANDIVVIGGGFIGLELAALAAEKGKKVTVIEPQSRLMERVLPPVVSEVFFETHQQHGVKVLLHTSVQSINAENEIRVSIGEVLRPELIIAGIGVVPESELAQAAGLACQNGILVNSFQQTSVDSVYAIGDCANHFNPYASRNIRLESVQNAVDQAQVAALHIVGKPKAYDAVPWFWTNQYHLKLQMAGISEGYDQHFIRGDKASGKFSVYYYKNNKLIAVDSLNKAADHLNARKLLEAGISPLPSQLVDPEFKLNQLLSY